MNKAKAVALLSKFVPLLSQIQGACSGGAMDDQQRKSNGQFGSGGGGSAAKGGSESSKSEKIDASNEAIRNKSKEIAEASHTGIRGERLLAMKAELRQMQAKHKTLVKSGQDEQQRKGNGQFGSGGGGSAAKGGKKAVKITPVAFTGQMNKKTFSPTNAQLTAISNNTQETVGRASLSIGMLNQHDLSAGTGTINHEGKTYKVHRLASNNKWYVTG